MSAVGRRTRRAIRPAPGSSIGGGARCPILVHSVSPALLTEVTTEPYPPTATTRRNRCPAYQRDSRRWLCW